ncbi:sulfatase family protein [Hyphococcus luteus]|uniref:Twin-arginine translocation pathway signal protein n=1 Tax=Hyphococcus luteus TaxID=2058213 RepID=A0A2S7K555_9PROT|nr:sulfatase-like hydrolase/transferase [Marinicaulis flavus]PQA87647.1 twin-arginine translocation pathway signal protein [Marinicaulis flavus]
MPRWDRRKVLNVAAATAATTSFAPFGASAGSKQDKPNILFIMADDLGYADLSCYGRRDFETPVLDALAEDGLRLTDCYSNSPVCSATRLALITGRYQYRLPFGLEEPSPGKSGAGLPADHPTLPSLLRDAGYRTTLIGKWHLGSPPDYGPLKSGYDRFYGVYGGGDYFQHAPETASRNDGVLTDQDEPSLDEGYMTDLLADRAVLEIETAHKHRKPFFISLHFTAPHWPWEGPDDEEVSENLSNLFHFDGGSIATYARMVKNLDANIGRVLQSLRKAGLHRDTIVVFTSDNGGERFSDSWPFVGVKGEVLEGGIRVPGLIRWPGRIKKESVSDQIVTSMDWMPVLLSAADASPDPAYPPDGVNLLPEFQNGSTRSRKLYWRFKANDQAALRSDNWKYLSIGGAEHLFNLKEDERERADLKERNLDIFASLKADYEAWNETMLPYEASTFSHDVTMGNYSDRY